MLNKPLGCGAGSYTNGEVFGVPTAVEFTASNGMVTPSTVAEYGTTGKNPGTRLIVYSLVSTPTMVLRLPG